MIVFTNLVMDAIIYSPGEIQGIVPQSWKHRRPLHHT